MLVTSIIHHSHYNVTTCIIDKIAVYMVVFYGGYLFYQKCMGGLSSGMEYFLSFIITFTFLLTAVLYYYGKMNQCFCFYQEESISARYHDISALLFFNPRTYIIFIWSRYIHISIISYHSFVTILIGWIWWRFSMYIFF